MPHKFSAFSHCATSSERARTLGVVSVIRRNPDLTWHGDMLDGLVFVKAQKDLGALFEGARALLIGAGRAIALAILEAGVSKLIVHDAVPSRVASLLDLTADLGDSEVELGPPDPTDCELVFNATGHEGGISPPRECGFAHLVNVRWRRDRRTRSDPTRQSRARCWMQRGQW
jgi:shikimate dehydrogenase